MLVRHRVDCVGDGAIPPSIGARGQMTSCGKTLFSDHLLVVVLAYNNSQPEGIIQDAQLYW